jgi:hypothetical protein
MFVHMRQNESGLTPWHFPFSRRTSGNSGRRQEGMVITCTSHESYLYERVDSYTQ